MFGSMGFHGAIARPAVGYPGEPLAAIMPDKDYAIVDGHTYVLQKYRKRAARRCSNGRA